MERGFYSCICIYIVEIPSRSWNGSLARYIRGKCTLCVYRKGVGRENPFEKQTSFECVRMCVWQVRTVETIDHCKTVSSIVRYLFFFSPFFVTNDCRLFDTWSDNDRSMLTNHSRDSILLLALPGFKLINASSSMRRGVGLNHEWMDGKWSVCFFY